MSYVVSIDPGLDATGVACWDLRGWRPREPWADVLRRLAQTEVIRTSPETAMPDRLGALHERVTDLLRELRPERCYIETPAIAGVYAARRGRQRGKSPLNAESVQKLNWAIGALVTAATGELVAVQLVPAPKIPKEQRIAFVRTALAKLGHPLGAQARVSPDLLDAIYLGATCLTIPQYQPVLSPN